MNYKVSCHAHKADKLRVRLWLQLRPQSDSEFDLSHVDLAGWGKPQGT